MGSDKVATRSVNCHHARLIIIVSLKNRRVMINGLTMVTLLRRLMTNQAMAILAVPLPVPLTVAAAVAPNPRFAQCVAVLLTCQKLFLNQSRNPLHLHLHLRLRPVKTLHPHPLPMEKLYTGEMMVTGPTTDTVSGAMMETTGTMMVHGMMISGPTTDTTTTTTMVTTPKLIG